MAAARFVVPNASFHSPNDVALIPLLQEFQITNDSPLITQILLEQQLVDTLSLIRLREKEARERVKREEADANEQAKKNSSSKDPQGSKKKSKKLVLSKEDKLAKEQAEMLLEDIVHAYRQAQGRLDAQAHQTQQAIVSHHGIILQKMKITGIAEDKDEDRDLFLSAYKELWNNEKRHLYIKEMIPVMKQVGEENNGEDVIQLPYIQLFQISDADSPIVTALINEQYLLGIETELKTRIAKPDSEQKILIKNAEEKLSRCSEAAAALIQKHYRRQSVKIHPDRKGESYRKAFEDFTDARNVLRDDTLRRLYLREMLSVAKTFGKGYMESSHDAWNNKNRPDIAERDGAGFHDDQQKQGKTMRLQGGLHEQMPRGPMLQHQGEKVTVSVHVLRPPHEFYSRVKSITVVFRSNDDDSHILNLGRLEIVKEIKYDRRGDMYGNLIKVGEVENLSAGEWEVSWSAVLDSAGVDPTNPYNATQDEIKSMQSSVAHFSVKDKDYELKVQQFLKAEASCRICIGELQIALNKLRNLTGAEPIRRYGLHHEVVVRAGKKVRALKWSMNATEKTSSVYDTLNSMLVSVREELSLLEDSMDKFKKKKDKKNMLRNFKARIADVLESADPASWMDSVTEEQLQNEGGDANRLYQLLIEGKGQFQLMIDSDMLWGASLRQDLFSSKQCTELEMRTEDAVTQEAEDEEEARIAEEKRQVEEEAKEELLCKAELERKWSLVGNTVTVNGLTSSKGRSLNGKTASVVDYSKGKDRFEVRFTDTEDKAYLKEDHMKIYFYGQLPQVSTQEGSKAVRRVGTSEPWACTHCTFLNEGDHENCAMCTKVKLSRPEAAAQPEETQEDVENEASVSVSKDDEGNELSETLWVTSSFSKKLTGKKGRKKKDLMAKSGAKIDIDTNCVSRGRFPVHFVGSEIAVRDGISLVKEIVGSENTFGEPGPDGNSCIDSEDPIKEVYETHDPETISPPVNTSHSCIDSEDPIKEVYETLDPETISPQVNASQSLDRDTSKKHVVSGIGVNHEFPGFQDLTLDESLSSIADSNQTSMASMQSGLLATNLLSSQDDGLELLLDFLHDQEACIKGDVNDFFKWLVSEDIDSMHALKEAVSDEDYLSVCLQVGNGAVGLKGFKRKAFQRAVVIFCFQSPDESKDTFQNMSPAQDTQSMEIPKELYCPIGNVIMISEPVLAGDGFTYEKSSIERWFSVKVREIIEAEENLKDNPNSICDCEVVNAGIRSPVTGEPLPHLTLTPNTNVRDVARQYHALRQNRGLA